MKVLFEVTTPDSAHILIPLANACDRAGLAWQCFFTGDGVVNLSDNDVINLLESTTSSIACEMSWEKHRGEEACPIKLGSQTNNSEIVGDSDRIISL